VISLRGASYVAQPKDELDPDISPQNLGDAREDWEDWAPDLFKNLLNATAIDNTEETEEPE
jgi:hypothetical protein